MFLSIFVLILRRPARTPIYNPDEVLYYSVKIKWGQFWVYFHLFIAIWQLIAVLLSPTFIHGCMTWSLDVTILLLLIYVFVR